MTYAESVAFLYDLRLFGAKLGLENTLRLAALAGNPHEKLRFIHVAGTNGKGSTCAMLESIYRASGLRVGLYTSPHLVSFCERIQVNREPISEDAVVTWLRQLRVRLADFSHPQHPTFFEVVTVLALLHFAEQRCDLVIWETGMGGRLDATNIVTPLASVITNVTLDHQRWLGNTVRQIAAEKAGIIKPGVPIITGAEGEALEVIREIAERSRSELIIAAAESALPSRLPLRGGFQRKNAAVALAAVQALQKILPVSDDAVSQGLRSVHWPGRMQEVTLPSGNRLLLDGAHNLAGIHALVDELRSHYRHLRPTLLFGVLEDKDWPAMLNLLAPVVGKIYLVPVQSARGLPPEQLASACRRLDRDVPAIQCSALSEALQRSQNDALTVLAGSLYLAGEAMELLGLAGLAAQPERALNEWSASRP